MDTKTNTFTMLANTSMENSRSGWAGKNHSVLVPVQEYQIGPWLNHLTGEASPCHCWKTLVKSVCQELAPGCQSNGSSGCGQKKIKLHIVVTVAFASTIALYIFGKKSTVTV